jgi:hypothetical protein
MYAYAMASDTKVIDIISMGDYHNEISNTSKAEAGVITSIGTVFKNMKKPAPFFFIWVPNKNIPKTLFTALKSDESFYLDMRIQILDGDSVRSGFYFNFHECKLQKSRNVSGGVKISATYGGFDMSDPQG